MAKTHYQGYSSFSPRFSSSTVLLSYYFSCVSQVAVTYNVFLFLIDIVDYNLGTKLISQNIAPLLVGSVHAEYFSDYNLSLENLAIMLHLCLRLLSSVSWSHTLCFWRRNIGDMVSWTVRETIQVFADFFFFQIKLHVRTRIPSNTKVSYIIRWDHGNNSKYIVGKINPL